MRKTIINYSYKVKEGQRFFSYSGLFRTKKAAKKWYIRYGKFLENEFDRHLILKKTISYNEKM